MLLLIPLLPFAGFLINSGLGGRLGKASAARIACAAMGGSLVLSVLAVWRLLALPADARAVSETVFTWISAGSFTAPLTLRIDPLSGLMILVVTLVGSLIHVYSTAYMHDERDHDYARYFAYLNLFAAFMLLLVLGANFLVLFVGWEGVGLCSYLLIGFWHQKRAACDAGKKAFVVNRIGDAAFLLGVLLVATEFGTVDFEQVATLAARRGPEAAFGVVSALTLLLFVGATGKSAQLPLYVWLPDAMEGPTPVSALIHAATMVTAGVYLIARNAVLFSLAPGTLMIVATVGATTAFVAATIGLVQTDIKRVLAYSTISQLGYMFLAMGVGAFAAGIFHLYTHAFFKALLFLGAGAVIHALSGEQDLRRMGGLRRHLRITYWTFLAGALAIVGFPGLAGFFSKDEILFRTFASGHLLLWGVALATSLLTAVYMARLVILAFHGEGPSWPAVPERPHETGDGPGAPGRRLHDAPPAMAAVLAALAVGSIVAGYVGVPHALGGANRLDAFLLPSVATGVAGTAEVHVSDRLELTLMAVSTLVTAAGLLTAALLFQINRRAADGLAARFPGIHRLLEHKYYVDEVYEAALVQPIHLLSREGLWKRVDVVGIDGAVNGVGVAIRGLGQLFRRVQTGSVRAYAVTLFLGVVLILGYFLWR